MFRKALAVAILAAPALDAGAAATRVACPAGTKDAACEFTGNDAIQQAVDAAAPGDTVLVRAGVYSPDNYRDVPFEKLMIRGYVVADGKDLEIRGEPGAVLDGSKGKPASAIVTRGGRVTVRNLTIRDFRAGDPEDDIYDGHGIFLIDTQGTVDDVSIERVRKMALTVRGTGKVRASRLRILDGHVGIWLEETAHLDLSDALVRNNDSAGICAYMSSTASIARSAFEKNQDDGVYAAQQASIEVRDSTLRENEPLDVNAVDDGRIVVEGKLTRGPGVKPASK